MSIKDALAQYKAAAGALTEATARELPVGRTVAVTIGRVRILGVITHVGSSHWPADVTIRNIKTGKSRTFSATGVGHDPILTGV